MMVTIPAGKIPFHGKVLMIGCGSVGQCTLPLLLRHLDIPASSITVLDTLDMRGKIREPLAQGVQYVQAHIEPDNLDQILSAHLGAGDILLDLSWNIGANDIVSWCHEHGVNYLNTSVEEWNPAEDQENKTPHRRALYYRQMGLRKLKATWAAKGTAPGPTMLVDHGANPGWVSHLTKRALLEIGTQMLKRGIATDNGLDRAAFERTIADADREMPGAFARLAHATGVKVIHISERDTQISDVPKSVDEFVNTWSIEGLYEEGVAPAEMGWGTHERRLPDYAYRPDGGPGNQIFIAQPGIRTMVRSWVPLGGEIIGMVVRHAEAFTISDALTVWENADPEVRQPIYRPTVHYAYMPCDNALLSVHELAMRNWVMQPRLRIMQNEIISGRDELGVLLLGHKLGGWWTGSQLDIHQARALVPGQNATTVQVAAAVLGGLAWMIKHPDRGLLVPDELPHKEVMEWAYPYLGPCPSVQTDWTPLKNRRDFFERWGRRRPADEDVWQFGTFLVEP